MNSSETNYRAALLISSDRAYEGTREDRTDPILRKRLSGLNYQVMFSEVVPDDESRIIDILNKWIDGDKIDLILTSGGTGVAPRDVIPEATSKIIEKRIPGIEETMRRESAKSTPNAMLSRGIAGISGKSLIINLPGNPEGALENLNVVAPALRHALDLINGKNPDL
jgi:molybdopterin adenylyltransferase